MLRCSLLILVAGFVLAPGLGATAVAASDRPDANAGLLWLAEVDAAAAAGEITADDALVYKLAYGFAPETLPARFRPLDHVPLKCATDLIVQFDQRRAGMATARVKQVDAWPAPKGVAADKAICNSPGGHFTLTCLTTGTNAVPAADTSPANGIPDYVEKVATYCDCTSVVTAPTGATRITLHHNFLGFPPSTDPEGNQWGAAKVGQERARALGRARSRGSDASREEAENPAASACGVFPCQRLGQFRPDQFGIQIVPGRSTQCALEATHIQSSAGHALAGQ